MNDPADAYFADHGIDPLIAGRCGVRRDGNTLAIPYKDRDGSVLYEKRRSLTKKAFWYPAGARPTLYWPFRTKDMKAVLLCEGEADALSAVTALKSLALLPVALPSATMNAESVALQLEAEGVSKVWLALDADEAGRRATENIALALCRNNIQARTVPLPAGKDLSDCLVALGPGWLKAALRVSKPAITPELRGRLYSSLSPAEQRQGVETRTASEAVRSHYTASEGMPDLIRDIPAEVFVKHFTGQDIDETRKVNCPFHEDKTPSLHVYPGGGGWFCFGACQEGGTVYDFAMKLWNCDFGTARERLMQEFDIRQAA